MFHFRSPVFTTLTLTESFPDRGELDISIDVCDILEFGLQVKRLNPWGLNLKGLSNEILGPLQQPLAFTQWILLISLSHDRFLDDMVFGLLMLLPLLHFKI